jgi:hypothetical protein
MRYAARASYPTLEGGRDSVAIVTSGSGDPSDSLELVETRAEVKGIPNAVGVGIIGRQAVVTR